MTKNEYTAKAEKFLTDTATTMEVVKAVPQKAPLWAKEGEKHGIQYSVTLSNDKAKYTFDFWGSIADSEMLNKSIEVDKMRTNQSSLYFHVVEYIKRETGKPQSHMQRFEVKTAKQVDAIIAPNAYDVLACISPLYEDNFEDFCGSFGYDIDSINALKTFEAVKEQDRMLRKLFTAEQLETLSEIN